MKKIVLSSMVVMCLTCSAMAEDGTETQKSGSGDGFKSFVSKTYNFLGIQTKDETNTILSSMSTDIEALKKAANELKIEVTDTNKNLNTQNEKITQEIMTISSEQKNQMELINQKGDAKEIESLKKDLSHANNEIKSLGGKIEALEEIIAKLTKTIAELPTQSAPASN